MRAFRKSFSMFAAAVISLVAASCALFGDEEPSAERNFVEPALTASVRGSVAVSGAAPGVFRKSSARTALPSLNGVSYSVVASGGGRTYKEDVDAENLSFSFGELSVGEGGTEYTITATGTVSGIEVVSGSCTVTLRPGDALVEDITVKPCAVSESGKVNLTIGIDSGVSESIKSCEISGEGYSKNVAVSDRTIIWKSESGDVPAGTYTFSFYNTESASDGNRILLYEFRESLHVCKSLVTDSWFGSSAYITDGECVITKTLVDKFALSRIYVSSRKEDSKETGTRAEPYKSVARAMNALLDKDTDYTILVDGELTGAQEIPASVTTANASSITIQGRTGSGTDKINGNNAGTALTIKTAVPVTIENLTITGGKNASGNGGGIYLGSGSNVTLGTGALVGDLTQTTASATSFGNYANFGGGIYNEGSLTLGSGAIVRHNYASPFGGGIWNEGGSVTIKEGAEISYNCAGTSDARGGGIRSGGSGSFLTMEGGTISHNSVSHWGGGVMIQGSEFTMTGGTISFNKSTGSSGIGAGGGGIWIDDGTFKMSGDSILSGNEANNKGGGIHVEHEEATVEILGGTISGNKASVSGGAISNNLGKITISGGTIENNSAVNGGGIYNEGNLYLSAGVISKNTASGSGDNGRGGGVYSTGTLFMYGSAVIGDLTKTEVATDSAFSNKAAFGGGIYSKGNVYLGFSSEDTEATLTGGVCYNYANNTGGITQDAGYESASKTFKIASGVVSYNSQRGIYIGKNTFTMTGGTVSGNKTLDTVENSEKNGSGIYIGYDTNVVISGGSITANRACLHGGGMYVAQASSNVTIGGGSISSNTAGGNGSGIAVNLGSLKMQGGAKIDSSNDVYLPSGKYITITDALTGTAPVAKITLDSYEVGTKVLENGAGVVLADEVRKFALTSDDYFIGEDGTLIDGYTAAKAISSIPSMTETGVVKVIGEISSEDITNLTTALKTLNANNPDVRITLDLSRTTGLTELPSYAFTDEDYQNPGCLALEKIKLPSGLTKIGECNFRECTNLTTITIPAGVTEICDTAFVKSGLSGTLLIPASVCKFGYGVFSGTTVTLEYEDTTSIWTKYKYTGAIVTENDPNFSSTPFSGTCPTRETISAGSQGSTYLQKN